MLSYLKRRLVGVSHPTFTPEPPSPEIRKRDDTLLMGATAIYWFDAKVRTPSGKEPGQIKIKRPNFPIYRDLAERYGYRSYPRNNEQLHLYRESHLYRDSEEGRRFSVWNMTPSQIEVDARFIESIIIDYREDHFRWFPLERFLPVLEVN